MNQKYQCLNCNQIEWFDAYTNVIECPNCPIISWIEIDKSTPKLIFTDFLDNWEWLEKHLE